jgi:protein-disulfide isomerase
VPYNQAVSKAILALICAPLLMGGACEKKSPKASDTGALNALDHSGSAGAEIAQGPVDTTPLPGIDTSKLGDKTETFYKLVGSLQSPCPEKPESLRVAFEKNTACKRAPFAVRYVMALLEDEATEAQARDEYKNKYQPTDPKVNIDVSKAPHEGATDAPVKFIEFYDYGCPHCAAFKPMMDQVLADEQGKVVTYFMMFPLEKHTDSKSAAQAALAANAQGKFKEMHTLLFEKTPEHDHAHVTEYAKQLGLDMGKFESDYNAFAPQVVADMKQGDAAGVDSTPTLFFNDRKYDGPMHPKYIEMWVEEELAVNR